MRDDAHLLCAVRNAHAKVVVVLEKSKRPTNPRSARSLLKLLLLQVDIIPWRYCTTLTDSISECVMMQFNIANRTYVLPSD